MSTFEWLGRFKYKGYGDKRGLERHVAMMPQVQAALKTNALIGGEAARARLEAYRATAPHTQHQSRIVVTKGKVDHYIVLDDETSGDKAAGQVMKHTGALQAAVAMLGGAK